MQIHHTPDASQIQDSYEATELQKTLLFITASVKRNPPYVNSITLQIPPQYALHQIRRSWFAVVQGHSALRTGFCLGENGVTAIVYKADSDDLSPLLIRTSSRKIEQEEITQGFIAEERFESLSGNVLVSALCCGSSSIGFCLTIVTHHAIADGTSLVLIIKQLKDHLSAPTDFIIEESNFATYARFQNASSDNEECEFYKAYLAGLSKNTSRPWPLLEYQDEAVGHPCAQNTVSRPVTAVDSVYARMGVSLPPWIYRLALSLLIQIHSHSDEVIFAEVISTRKDIRVVGPMITQRVVRSTLNAETTLRFYQQALSSLPVPGHGTLGLGRIIHKFCPELHDAISVLLICHTVETWPPNAVSGDWKLTEMKGAQSFPLVFHIEPPKAHIREFNVRIQYDSKYFSERGADGLLRQYALLLEILHRASAQPETTVQQALRTLGRMDHLHCMKEASLLGGAKVSTHRLKYHNLCDMLADTASRLSQKIAVQHGGKGGEFFTYHQLSRDVARVSAWIQTNLTGTKGFQQLIPISCGRSYRLNVAMFGVMKAGSAFMPLDSEQPYHRLHSLLGELNVPFIFVDEPGDNLRQVCDTLRVPMVQLRAVLGVDALSLLCGTPLKAQHSILETTVQSREQVAYVLHTSGSSGKPKAVMVTHSNVIHFIVAALNVKIVPQWWDRQLGVSSFVFDVSMIDNVCTLCTGGLLCMPNGTQGPFNIPSFILDMKATSLITTPSMVKAWNKEAFRQLQVLTTIGEPFDTSLLSLVPDVEVINAYGPTETTIACTSFQYKESLCMKTGRRYNAKGTGDKDLHEVRLRAQRQPSNVSIGTPLGGTKASIFYPGTTDPVPIGAIGELCISGPLVSRGYLNNPEETSKHFITSPIPSQRTYRTGDMSWLSHDMKLHYVGRQDNQVKIRGMRVELAEIEEVLIRKSNTFARQIRVVYSTVNSEGSKILAACWSPSDNVRTISSESDKLFGSTLVLTSHRELSASLHTSIASLLPAYMVPDLFICLERLPLSSSGKVDGKQLQALVTMVYAEERDLLCFGGSGEEGSPSDKEQEREHVPTTILQASLARVWAEVLGLEDHHDVRLQATFRQLGGDSLSLIKLVSAALVEQIRIPLSEISVESTLCQMANAVEQQNTLKDKFSPQGALVNIRYPTDDAPWLVLVHPGFGFAQCYQALSPHLKSVGLIGISDPFFGTSQGPRSIEQLAACYVEMVETFFWQQEPPRTNIFLGGWSFGGLVAFEMARKAQHRWSPWSEDEDEAGHRIPLVLLGLLMIDSPQPDNKTRMPFSADMYDDTMLIDYAAHHGLEGLSEQSLALFRNEIGKLSRFGARYLPEGKIQRTIHYLQAAEKDVHEVDEVDIDPLEWAPFCGKLVLDTLSGNHASVLDQDNVQELASKIERICLSVTVWD